MPKKLPPEILKFFQEAGAEGGKNRAKKYSKEQLVEWGRKGGRPKKQSNTATKKGTK